MPFRVGDAWLLSVGCGVAAAPSGVCPCHRLGDEDSKLLLFALGFLVD